MRGGAAAFVALVFALGGNPAHAATLRVPSEYATINVALDASASGDSVLVAPGTYSDYETRVLQGGGLFTASSVAFLKAGVSLIGEGGREVTRIDLAGQGTGSAVPVMAYGLGPGTVLVQGFTITGAPVGNSGMWSRFMDRMEIRECRFEDLDGGTASYGGLYSESVELGVYDTEFVGCRADGRVGALVHVEGYAFLSRCAFVDCVGVAIVGLNAGGPNPPRAGAVLRCTFSNNLGKAATITQFASMDVEDCVFVGNHNPGVSTYVVGISGGDGGIVEPGPYSVRRNVFVGNTPRALLWDRVWGFIEENTFSDNGEQAVGLTIEEDHAVTLRRNIVAYTAGFGIQGILQGAPLPVLECNAFWENSGGDTDGFSPGPTDLFVDPLFCDRPGGDYTVARNSPCLPPQSGSCGQIGALGEGCSEISVERESWAKTKAKYRAGSGRREER